MGFVMLDDNPEEQEYFLWRLMVDAEHQGRGYGRRAFAFPLKGQPLEPFAIVTWVAAA